MKAPELSDGSLLLRSLKPADKQDKLAAGLHSEIRRMYGADRVPLPDLSEETVDAWYEQANMAFCTWAIERSGRCIGIAKLHQHDEQARRARYAIGLFSPEHLGGGTGTAATRLVLDFAFGRLGLHRVELMVLEYNVRAIRCYEKCGFRKEGVLRHSALVDGVWENDIMMSILEHEYEATHYR